MSSTISQLASQLKLSKATVSRILNHKGDAFSPETRRRVFAAARAVDYRPHPIARALATGRTGFVGVLVDNLGTAYHAHVAHTMEDRLKRDGYGVFIALPARFSPNRDRKTPFLPIVADGIISHQITGSAWEELHHSLDGRIPIINTGVWIPPDGLDCVLIDLSPATLAAIRHLVQSGRRRIAYLTDVFPTQISSRYEDYRRTIRDSGLTEEYLVIGSTDHSLIRAWTRHYIQENGCPEGIFCHNDDMAIAAYCAACDLHIRVPDDLAIIGCDGIHDMEYLPCPLSTIVQPLDAMCETAARFLERRLAEPDSPPQCATLLAELALRESSR